MIVVTSVSEWKSAFGLRRSQGKFLHSLTLVATNSALSVQR